MDGADRRGWRAGWALVLAVVAVVALVRLPSFVHQLYDPDEAAIAAQAISVRSGGTLYVDVADRKPPLPPLLYALSFGLTDDTDLRPLHGLAGLGLVGAALVVAFDARRRAGPEAGWWGAAMVVGGAVAFFPVDAQAANYAHLALFPGTVAVVAARRGARWSPLLAGIALGAAILCRQSWLLGVVPAALGAAMAATPGRRARWYAVLGVVAGTAGAVALVGTVVPFWDFWRWTFTDNSGFVLAGASTTRAIGAFAASVAIFVGFHLTLVALLGVLAWRVVVRGEADYPAEAPTLQTRGWSAHLPLADLDLWLWLFTGCAAVVAGFRFFGHYWMQVIPPAALLAAPVAVRLGRRWRPWLAAGLAVPVVAAVAFAWTPTTFRTLPDPAPLADFVRSETEPGDPVWIWGTFPEVYWMSDRPPGGALVHSDFVTGLSGGREPGRSTHQDATPGAEAHLLEQLRAHPPALVIDTSTRDLRQYGSYPVSDFPAVHDYLVEHFRKGPVVDGAQVWVPRRP